MRVKTNDLQKALTIVAKGIDNNKLIPITSMVSLKVEENVLWLTTTNLNDYISASVMCESLEDSFDMVTLDIQLFFKLILKLTCEFTELKVQNSLLVVKGNGTYKLDLQFDDQGKQINLVIPDVSQMQNVTTLSSEIVKEIIDNNKSALATTVELPIYANYYVGQSVISTDTYKICELKRPVLSSPKLISKSTIDLLNTMSGEIRMDEDKEALYFVSEGIKVYSKKVPGIENYQIGAITNLLAKDFDFSCSVNRKNLIDILERINLFVTPYDDDTVQLNFTTGKLLINSNTRTGVEDLEFVDTSEVNSFNCSIYISMLLNQLKSIKEDVIELWYGDPKALKIKTLTTIQILGLVE